MDQSDYRNDYRADWRQGHFRGPCTTWKQNTQAYAIGMSLTLFPVVLNNDIELTPGTYSINMDNV